MKTTLFYRLAIAAVTLALPVAALADISNTVTLSAGMALNLDTGATATTGGDILYTGSSITYQGKAKGGVLPYSGSFAYSQIDLATLEELAPLATTTPIPDASIPVDSIIAVETNGANGAKLLVTAISASSITLEYTTFIVGGTTGGGPTVTGITNNYSYIPSGFPNSGVSPGSIITIFGTGLANAPSGPVTLESSAGGGIPKSLAGASIAVTVNGTTVTPGMYYATPTAIAAVLPSSTPTGAGTLTVTYNRTAGNSFAIQVVPNAMGLDTYYGTGSGLVTATNPTTGALYTYTNSASPGDTIVLWGSGLGADTADSDTVFTTTPHAVNAPVKIYFGGVAGTVTYAGSSGYPGLNQINVVIPASAPTGCNNAVVATIGNYVSNFGAIPINQGGGSCSDSIFGISGTQIGTLSGKSTVKYGDLFVGQATGSGTTTNAASAIFESVTGASYGAKGSGISLGSCAVTETLTGGTIPTITGLDAGNLSLTGPAGTYSLTQETVVGLGFYDAMLPDGAITSSGGAFTFNGSGGKDVGSFSATINLPNPLLSWTNQSAAATITRSQGLQVTWTGGAAGSYVIITGSSSGNGAIGSYTCYAPQSDLQFTVPAYVTGSLPAGTGDTSVENATNFVTFTATGLDFGIGFGFTSAMVNSTYQ